MDLDAPRADSELTAVERLAPGDIYTEGGNRIEVVLNLGERATHNGRSGLIVIDLDVRIGNSGRRITRTKGARVNVVASARRGEGEGTDR